MPQLESIRHRQRQLAIRAAAIRELLALWRTVDPTNLAETIGPFARAAAVVVGARYGLSAAAALDYYRRLRDGRGGLTILGEPQPLDSERAAALLRGAGLSGIVNGRRAGQSIEAATQNGFVKVAGSASGLILGAARESILQAAKQDPSATGRWQRITGAKSCAFCQMLAGRGPVFSEETVGFQAHDHCGCMAEPEFS